jgi:hypothetical protein
MDCSNQNITLHHRRGYDGLIPTYVDCEEKETPKNVLVVPAWVVIFDQVEVPTKKGFNNAEGATVRSAYRKRVRRSQCLR